MCKWCVCGGGGGGGEGSGHVWNSSGVVLIFFHRVHTHLKVPANNLCVYMLALSVFLFHTHTHTNTRTERVRERERERESCMSLISAM